MKISWASPHHEREQLAKSAHILWIKERIIEKDIEIERKRKKVERLKDSPVHIRVSSSGLYVAKN